MLVTFFSFIIDSSYLCHILHDKKPLTYVIQSAHQWYRRMEKEKEQKEKECKHNTFWVINNYIDYLIC